MTSEIIIQAVGVVSCLLLSYSAGSILWLPLGVREKDPALTSFGKLALGAIGIAAGTALYYTKGVTVCLGIFGLYLGAIVIVQPGKKIVWSKTRIEYAELSLVLVAALTYLVIQWLTNSYFAPATVSLGDEDYGIYAATAEYLKITGLERPSPWYELTGIASTGLVEPYHYPDLWLAAFSSSSRLSSLSSYNYIFIPFACSLCFSANRAIFSRYSRQLSFGILISFLAIFFPALFWGLSFSGGYSNPVYIWTKMVMAYWLFSGAFILIRQDKQRVAYLLICALPVLNIVYAPVVCLYFLFVFIQKALSEKGERRALLKILLYPLSTAGFLAGLYLVFGNWAVGSENASLPVGEYLWRMVRGCSAAVIKHAVFVWPLTLFAAAVYFLDFSWIKKEKNTVQLWLFLFSSAVICKGIFNANGEVDQFFLLTANPIAAVVFILLCGSVVSEERLKNKFNHGGFKLSVLLVLIWSFLQITVLLPQHPVAGRGFLEQGTALLAGKNPIGGAIANLDRENFYSADPRMCLFGNFLGMVGSGYWANSLSVPVNEGEMRFPERKGAIRRSPFYRFIQTQQSASEFVGYEQAQLDFIQQQRIDFIVVEKGASIPARIAACAQTALVDPYSGTTLLILQRPCAY